MNNQQQYRPQQRPQVPANPQPAKLPLFTVTRLVPVETGNLKAFVDIAIGKGPNAITVCKWRLIQQDEQEAWLSAPQESWQTDAGERRYTNLFVYPKEWKDGLTAAAIAAWEQYQSDGRFPE